MGRLTSQQLMSTAVIALKVGDSIGLCREEMDRAALRDLPVIDDHGRLVGVVSSRDLHRALQKGFGLVADIMTAGVTVHPNTPALDAVERLIDLNLGSVPVVANDGRLLGVVTETAFLIVARQALGGGDARRSEERPADPAASAIE